MANGGLARAIRPVHNLGDGDTVFGLATTTPAEGLSNQDIAQRLVISLPTVKWHTSHIFAKLGVHSRLEAVAFATKHRLF